MLLLLNFINFKNMMKKTILFLIFLVLPVGIFAQGSMGIINPAPNPSAAYCVDLGYEFAIQETKKGQLGICRVAEGVDVPAWSFLRGEEAREYSYCNKAGYEMKVVDDPKKCGLSYKSGHGCLACVLEDGSEVEAGSLMEIEKIEKSKRPTNPCNDDGKCILPETPQNCPQDCTTVVKREIHKDNAKNIIFAIVIISSIIIVMLILYYFLRKKKDNSI